MTVKVTIIGSGNIGTDLLIKVLRTSSTLEVGAFVGIDPESEGLLRAQRLGVPTTSEGIDGHEQLRWRNCNGQIRLCSGRAARALGSSVRSWKPPAIHLENSHYGQD